MSDILKKPKAKNDLTEIWDYIADGSEHHADRFIDQIEKKFNLLLKTPEIGRLRNELSEDLRSFPIGNYVIFYRKIKKDIEIIRVLHGSRDIGIKYFDDET